ncbi:putative late blight resistance protein homolog R1B-23 [Nicotiana tabacum]|uniref:Late blight resistance protein homolog R1B-23 n=1 Tax=Nicotiana tabacum TaxID=4097 RepID=A0AC58SIE8_TOBAC
MKSVEEVLEVFVDELISSSLVIVSNKRGGRNPSCQIHDLVHDFCFIKSRMEKLFDFISSSAPPPPLPPPPDVMPRGMTIHYDQHLHSDENFVLFYPEKKNPYVKHLVSLKVYKVGDVDYYIWTEAKALPPSFSNLLNLETLVAYTGRSNIVLSPSNWSLAKLRHVRTDRCSVFDPYINEQTVLEEDSKLENLRILYHLQFSHSEDTEDILKRFPNLRSLGFKIFEEPWNLEQVIFENLKSLTLYKMSFSEWKVNGEESFSVLEELCIQSCRQLMEIPDSFGDIASLKSISLWGKHQLKDSALKIKEYVAEMTGEDKLEVY